MVAPFIKCPAENIQVLLVNHSSDQLERDQACLSIRPGITVIGCAKSPLEALGRIKMQIPDVIISGAYFHPSPDNGDFFARQVRLMPDLPFRPGFAVLTNLYEQYWASQMSPIDGYFYLNRAEYADTAHLIRLVEELYQRAQAGAVMPIGSLRGDIAAQKHRWLRGAVSVQLSEDGGRFPYYEDDFDTGKRYLTEVIATMVESDNSNPCTIDEAMIALSGKTFKSTKYIARRILSYLNATTAYVRRHSSAYHPDNIFLVDRKKAEFYSVIEHYASFFRRYSEIR